MCLQCDATRRDFLAGEKVQTHRTGFSAPLCLVYVGSVSPAPLSRAAYAARLGVSPSAVSKLIARGKLTESAICDDGKINVAAADRQLHAALNQTASCAARNRRPRSRVPALADVDGTRAAAARQEAKEAQAALARAEQLAKIIAYIDEAGLLFDIVRSLDLSHSQAEALVHCWYRCRRRVSRRVASPG